MGEVLELWQEIKRVFDLELEREEYLACATPRHLIDLICSKLHIETVTGCPSQRAFYLLRKKIVETFRLPREQITPCTRLNLVLAASNQGNAEVKLRDSVRARVWPRLPASGCHCRALGAIGTAVFLPILLLNWQESWRTVWGACLQMGLLLLVACYCLMIVLGAGPHLGLKWRKAALRDLTPYVETSDHFVWTREKVAQAVRLIIKEQFEVPEPAYHEDARLVEDFRLDT